MLADAVEKIMVSEPKLAFQISKAFFVRFPGNIKVNRAIHAPLKGGPASAISCHVTQHLKGFFFISVNPVHTVSFGTILIIVKTALGAIFKCKQQVVKLPSVMNTL